jgi:hypothetical protein
MRSIVTRPAVGGHGSPIGWGTGGTLMTTKKRPARPASTRRPARASGPAGRVWLLVAAVTLVGLGIAAVSLRDRANSDGQGRPAGVLAEGATAPSVALPATTGGPVDLAGFRGKRNVLLYFYEHAG